MALAAYSTSLSAYAFANYRSKVLFAVLGCPLILATLPVVGVVLMAGGIATNSPSWTCVGVVLEVIELVIQVMFAVPLFLMALANALAGVIWVGILPIVFAAYLITECVFVALSLSMARDTPSSWKFV